MAKPDSKAPLGEGGRFEAFVSRLKGKGYSEKSAKSIAASAGKRKYGTTRFQRLASKGR